MKSQRLLPILLAAAAMAGQASAQGAAAGDAEHGAQVFATKCAACHSNAASMDVGMGPPLWGVVGRKAASAPGFNYSAALKGTGWSWDDAHLDTFLTNPMAAVPGTTMPMGAPIDGDRQDVIAYLKTLKK